MKILCSQGFHDELKRTIAYIGRQLEEGGEDVSWKKLDDDLKGKGSGSILHAMGRKWVNSAQRNVMDLCCHVTPFPLQVIFLTLTSKSMAILYF